jgi:hypothetical protein
MIDVTNEWWGAILIAAAAGAVGGLVYELLQARLSDAGMLERWSTHVDGSRSFWDLGFVASVIIGAVSAVAFLYFLTPTETVISTAQSTVTTRAYDPFKLIAASLIVGSAGGAFLTAMQERVRRTISETQLATMTTQVDAIVQEAKAGAAVSNVPSFETAGGPVASDRLLGMLDSIQQVVKPGRRRDQP